MNIGLFCPNWVGDLLMATPALREIRSGWPSARITAVLRPPLADVLAGTGLVDAVLEHIPRGQDSEKKGWGFAQELRAQRFDLAVLFPNSFRSAWWAWVSGARRRVGIARNGRGVLLTDRLAGPAKREPISALDEYWRIATETLVRIPGGVVSSRRPGMEAAVLPQDSRGFENVCSTLGWGPHERTGHVCLNPGGAFGAGKHWPTAYFAKLARRIADEQGSRVLVLCGPAERETARAIVRDAGSPSVQSLADAAPSIGLTKAAIASSRLLVTTDSGPRHFAPAFGIPVVSLFGPTHIGWSDTRYSQETNLQIPVDCGPCQQRTCPLGHHRCMTELTPEMVWRAVERELTREQAA
jgi:heptosyltransferase II